MPALQGHLAQFDFAGFIIPNKVSWTLKVTGRSPVVSSGEDTSEVTDKDLWQMGEGSFVALADKDADLVPVGERATGKLYRYSASTADVSSAAITDILTIDGTAYTKAAATDVNANEWADVAGLLLAINNFTFGSADHFTATAVGDVVTVVGFGRILVISKTEVVGTIALVDLSKWTTATISIEDVDEGPDMASGDKQEVTYTIKTSGPILDQDGNRR